MILIIGASRGIGKYLFEKFQSLNYQVLGTYNSTPSNADGYSKVDVRDFNQVSDWIEKEKQFMNKIVLINCAGITYNSFAHKSDPENWKNVIDVNLIGSYNFIRAVLPIMREQKYGRIINFSSVVAAKGTQGVSSYAASKSALWGMTKSITQENAAINITINNINMGYSSIGIIEKVPPEFLDVIIKQIPTGRLCEPENIFITVQYLIECSYINGASIDLNGGLN